MNIKSTVISLSLLLISGSALAGDDCKDPVDQWQPQDVLRQQLEEQGWTVQSIKVDDGCYKVKGRDADDHRVKAEFTPASLNLMEIEIKINRANASVNDDYRHKIQRYNKPANPEQIPLKDNSRAKPRVSIE
ncbi:PepSY domain-containing protein [Thiopseudomonas acetoxidans]|uniref:PepSY domain-containing protein n=1 Tax=Thiopseudomonas acetoxidans TaxID=3041622 RepID=A0ABT7ST44_9GAMM|nr:PepSY domain-containing protein [Thiopseudomonas sp. CY1220]MDM7858737.1 PepSY domain-containing protein [Thiopseudomonas sp. CY1220]